MGFLDNSGDIILDAVLTDLGRERLARGDGSFKITKFAVADDEIDYGKYNKNNPSGSAYYDLDILTTPILEAFTNNIGAAKYKLLTIPRNNLLYLPVIKLADAVPTVRAATFSETNSESISGLYVVSVDKTTSEAEDGATLLYTLDGVIKGDGEPESNGSNNTQIVTDQGLNTSEIPNSFVLDADLVENQYILEIDDRLGKIATPIGASTALASVNFVDDDRVASYYLSRTSNPNYFDSTFLPSTSTGTGPEGVVSAILGPRGTRLWFTIRASLELNTSTSLFDRLGNSFTIGTAGVYGTFKYIDSTVRITGVTTGYRIDVPIRFIKKTS